MTSKAPMATPASSASSRLSEPSLLATEEDAELYESMPDRRWTNFRGLLPAVAAIAVSSSLAFAIIGYCVGNLFDSPISSGAIQVVERLDGHGAIRLQLLIISSLAVSLRMGPIRIVHTHRNIFRARSLSYFHQFWHHCSHSALPRFG